MFQDLRYALRSFARTPGVTLLAVATLAIGIGANAAIFSVIRTVLLEPLPYPAAGRIVIPMRFNPRMGGSGLSVSPDIKDIEKWRTARSVEALTTHSLETMVLAGGEEPEEVQARKVATNFLEFAGMRPALGRAFTPEDAASPAAARVVLLTDAFWKRRFGGDDNVIGTRIELTDTSYEIVGVLPQDFRVPMSRTDLLMPLVPPPPEKKGEIRHLIVSALLRLREGVTPEAAAGELTGLGVEALGGDGTGWTVRLTRPSDMSGATFRRALFVLLAAVAFVLLIACANVANIILARNASREREIAVRAALGASRARLIRQLLTENLLLAAIGGVAGLLLGSWALQAITALRPPDLRELEHVSLDGRMMLASFALALLTGVIFGLLPAVAGTRLTLTEHLKQGIRALGGPRGQFARRALTIAEVALALVLVTGAGLLIRSYERMSAADLGFNPDQLLTVSMNLPDARYATPQQREEFLTRFAEAVRNLPGVRAAALATGAPPRGGLLFGQIFVEGKESESAGAPKAIGGGWVSPGFFEAMRIPIREGRPFVATDLQESACPLVVNEFVARQYWPGESALGKRVRMSPKGPWCTVVGVAGDVKTSAQDTPREQIYQVITAELMFGGTALIVSAQGDARDLIGGIKGQAWSLDPKLPMKDIETVEARISASLARPRFNLVLLSVFAGIGLTLAMIGIYGVISYAVGMRTQEIGVRMALGALPSDIRRAVLGEALMLSAVGVAVGLAGSLVLTRMLKSLLFEVSATDPLTLISVALLLLSAASLAAWIPARRAMRVDPMVALRAD